eukprot:symbB.v1.2.008251.t1/scaffold515.1/size193321/13
MLGRWVTCTRSLKCAQDFYADNSDFADLDGEADSHGLFQQLREVLRRSGMAPEDALQAFRKNFSKAQRLRCNRIFADHRAMPCMTKPVKLEICSGNGDWVIAQAKAEQGIANWIALELRHSAEMAQAWRCSGQTSNWTSKDDAHSEVGDDEIPAEGSFQVPPNDELPREINIESFNKLQLSPDMVQAAQQTWEAFLNVFPSKIAAGEAIFTAIFDASPSLQATFKSPKATVAERFVKGFGEVVRSAGSKSKMMNCVQILGFRHLEFDINIQKVDIFRDALIDLFEMEMNDQSLTPQGRHVMALLINYVGGALIFIRREYQSRIELIHSTWHVAKLGVQGVVEEEEKQEQETTRQSTSSSRRRSIWKQEQETARHGASGRRRSSHSHSQKKHEEEADNTPISNEATETRPSKFDNVEDVPTNFAEMFNFNVSAMGFSVSEPWMSMVLDQLDDLVMNVANTTRMKEECEKLALYLSKHRGPVVLSEVRSVALSSLKSFVSAWDEEHETAWTWFWTNTERFLSELDGKLQVQEQQLGSFMETCKQLEQVVQNIHLKFFEIAPAGQDFFKESKTRMYHIAERTLEIALAMYSDPKETVDELSTLGLRHVGMSIPVEFFPPFVQAAVEAIQDVTTDEMVINSFRWSITLVGKILSRTVTEGSTLVMRAITLDDAKAVRKAVSVTARGERASKLLNVIVGTHSISPLLWAIENASLVAADAILQDLLTIRADRHVYYYGCDALFAQHPDLIRLLINRARPLMPTLLDGLIWRSRYAVEGRRRVNYYVKHLIEDSEGNFNQALKWVMQSRDTELVRHPTFELVSDTVWKGLALRAFMVDQGIFLCFLITFVIAQSFLQHANDGNPEAAIRTITFACRLIVYLGNIPFLLVTHVQKMRASIREGEMVKIGILRYPIYLQKAGNVYKMGLLVCLILMCMLDPIFWCLSDSSALFTQQCATAEALRQTYSILSMLTTLFYWLILSELSGLSMRVSAYGLLCGQVLGELGLFLVSLVFLILTFASSLRDDLILFLALSIFGTLVLIFLLSLLVAQLNQASESRYDEMFGFARLHRCDLVVSLLEMVNTKKWIHFKESLQLSECLEFNAGDVGIAGGLQVFEPAVDHPTAVESIKRFGGASSAALPWPEEKLDEEDPFEELEREMLNIIKEGTRSHRKTLHASRSKSKQSTLTLTSSLAYPSPELGEHLCWARYIQRLARTISKLHDDFSERLFVSSAETSDADKSEILHDIRVICGKPGKRVGHIKKTTSYFDRLWAKGHSKQLTASLQEQQQVQRQLSALQKVHADSLGAQERIGLDEANQQAIQGLEGQRDREVWKIQAETEEVSAALGERAGVSGGIDLLETKPVDLRECCELQRSFELLSKGVSILSMALLIFLTIAIAQGASEEFWEGKLEQLSEDLRKNAQSLDQETQRVKKDADSGYGTWNSWDEWWDTSFHPKLERQIELVEELEKKLHQYRHVSQEVQIADKAQNARLCFGACVLVVVFLCGCCFGACVLVVVVVVFLCRWGFDAGALQGFIDSAVHAIRGAGCSLQGFMNCAVRAIRGRVAWLYQLVCPTCGLPEAASSGAARAQAASKTCPLLAQSVREQPPRHGASDASACSHSESGDSDSSWDKV